MMNTRMLKEELSEVFSKHNFVLSEVENVFNDEQKKVLNRIFWEYACTVIKNHIGVEEYTHICAWLYSKQGEMEFNEQNVFDALEFALSVYF